MPAGRPVKYKIDPEMLEKLASIHCTNTEIAAIFGCDSSLLGKGKYSDIIKKGKEKGKMTLRRKMFETAMGGNVTMQIWLSKQYLGMTEKVETVVESTNKTEIVYDTQFGNDSKKDA